MPAPSCSRTAARRVPTRHGSAGPTCGGFAVHLAHLSACRHGLAARPIGSRQQADLGAALATPPGRDGIVHGLALGTTHSEEGTS